MLSRSVGDLVDRDTLVSAMSDTTVRAAAKTMVEHVCGSILVTEEQSVVGIFTTHDLLTRVTAAGRDPDTTKLGDVMTRNPDTLPSDAPAMAAIRYLKEFGHRYYLLVVEGGRIIGVLSTHHMLFSEITRDHDSQASRKHLRRMTSLS